MKSTSASCNLGRWITLIVLTLLMTVNACYYDVEEEIYPSIDCNTDQVTYDTVISTIIKNRCYKCHNAATNTANINLEGYDNLKIYVANGKLAGTVGHKPGFSPMPKNEPQLVACEVAKIEAWIAAGTPK